MIFHATGKLCAVNLNDLELPISNDKALTILENLGFKQRPISLVAMAYSCIESVQYKRGVPIVQAPAIVDCTSFVKWLYAQKGVWLPRHSYDQRQYCEIEVSADDLRAGDLIFTSGRHDYYWNDPQKGTGHVGIAMGNGKVIHAKNSKEGVVEVSAEDFLSNNRGIRRIIENDLDVMTIESPPNRIVEWSQEFRWIILQHC